MHVYDIGHSIIRPATPDDAQAICEMRNEWDTRRFLHDARLYSIEETRRWLANLPADRLTWVVTAEYYSGPDNVQKVIGVIRISQLSWVNRNCYVGLDLHPDVRGKGLAKKVYAELLKTLFGDYNLHALYLEVLEYNTRAIKLYTTLGFSEVGRFPQRVFRRGKYWDSICMALLRRNHKSGDA